MNVSIIQDTAKYTIDQHKTWNYLYDRQHAHLQSRASKLYLDTLDEMSSSLTSDTIPVVEKMAEQLMASTGWSLKIVPGLIPLHEFFNLLANKTFCTSIWVRRQDQVDYIEEPDMFHDTFGHIPPLMNHSYASFMHRFGEVGSAFVKLGKEDKLVQLQRLYWFFVEFGFVREEGEPKLLGAGLMSSHGETNHAWSLRDKLIEFDLEEVMSTPFKTDVIQEKYFILDSISGLEGDLENWYNNIIKD